MLAPGEAQRAWGHKTKPTNSLREGNPQARKVSPGANTISALRSLAEEPLKRGRDSASHCIDTIISLPAGALDSR